MVRMMLMAASVAILGAALAVLPSPAADPPKPAAPLSEDKIKEQETQAADVETYMTALKLAETGHEEKWPETLVTAGALLLKLDHQTKGAFGELKDKPSVLGEDGKPISDAEVKSIEPESVKSLADAYFDEATALAKDQKILKEITALIKTVKARKYTETRGAIGGPKWFVRPLGPKQTHVYNINFDTFSIASVGFSASAPTRCTMQTGTYVHFNQVVRTGQYTWKPSGNLGPVKTFTITVRNPQNVGVTYKLVTN